MFDRIKSFLSRNRAGLSVLSFAAALGVLLFLAAGCKMTDFVKVDVPQQVREVTGAPAVVTLTDAPQVMEDYVRYGARFQTNIDESNERLGWFMAATDIGVRVGAAQLPAGGLALSLLTGVGGLLMKGPGTQKEKEKSYAKGRADAEAALLPLLNAYGVTVERGEVA